MRRLIIIVLCSLLVTHARAQGGIYGFEAGAGYGTAYKQYITPTVEGYCLKRLSASLYLGGALALQRYSFFYNAKIAAGSVNYGDLLSIRQTTNYLFFTPKIDLGIGYRKYIHFYFLAGPGIYMGGRQITDRNEPFWTTPSGASFGADTIAYTTTYNIPNITFRTALGISERIPTYRYFNIMLSEEFSYLPGHISNGSTNLKTNYFALSVGIMHKYPQSTIDED